MKEFEYVDDGSPMVRPLLDLEVRLPTLTTPQGTIVSGSSSILPVEDTKGSGTYKFFPIPELYVGVRLIDPAGDLCFEIVTEPLASPYDVRTALSAKPGYQRNNGKSTVPFVILPLIIP